MPALIITTQVPVSVALTNGAGTAVAVYSDAAMTSSVSLPLAVSSSSTVYVAAGPVRVVASDGSSAALLDTVVAVPISGSVTATVPAPSVPQLANLYSAQSVLAATADNSPAPVTLAEGTLLGRATGGDVAALTAAQVRTVIGVDASTATDWIGASRMTATTGSPSLSYVGAGGTSRAPAWLLDASSAESAYGALRIPAGWSSFHVDLWWSNAGAGSGDVVWRADRGVLEDGVAVPTLTSVTLAAVTAPAQNVIKVTRVLADIAAPAAGKIIDVGMLRDASAAGDTLANDVAFVGLMLIKAS